MSLKKSNKQFRNRYSTRACSLAAYNWAENREVIASSIVCTTFNYHINRRQVFIDGTSESSYCPY
jgi:hypothetical protein